ncbi:MAG: penicillin-binding transpeptidase domain-containing protein [Lachnospira sp.]|nr:penicillin-binding transpeptidase domain-containing protein [Lachnospira sp.]
MKRIFHEIAVTIRNVFRQRLFPVLLVLTILFCVLAKRVFALQILSSDQYTSGLASSIEKTMTTQATRGRIFDRNGLLLAYDDLSYAVVISDSGYYSTTEEKNAKINSGIDRALAIIEKNGDSYRQDFDMTYNEETGEYEFLDTGRTQLGFLRDVFGLSSISELTQQQQSATPEDIITYLCDKYAVDRDAQPPAYMLELFYLRIQMDANSYSRYTTFTIATDISDETMAAIRENADDLAGIVIDTRTVRRYNDAKYFSSIIGYTGTISSSQLEELNAQGGSYDSNDMVGKTGIESAMETELAGTKGTRDVYVDRYGRITEIQSETDSMAGHDIYLTIDANYQKALYDFIEEELVRLIKSKLIASGEQQIYSQDTGILSDYMIRMSDVGYACIDNGLVSLKGIESEATQTEAAVNEVYQARRQSVNAWIQEELTGSGTAYSDLPEEYRNYIWYIFQMLETNGIISTDKIDTSDEIYTTFTDGGAISFRDFLEHAVAQNWVSMDSLTDSRYLSLEEAFSILTDYITAELSSDRGFTEMVYKYLFEDGSLTARQMFMLLYEQGYLQDTDGYYSQLASGAINPLDYFETALTRRIITPGEIGLIVCSGSATVVDPSNGQLLALVSYPGYDNNRLSGTIDSSYYTQTNLNNSKPMYNWATQSQTAPGSCFKIVTAVSALMNGIVTPDTEIYCSGLFTEVTPNPHCWIYPGEHGAESLYEAIRDSCNVYFNTLGYDLAKSQDGTYNSTYATNILKSYAQALGLASDTGIEIAQADPQPSTTNAVASAIGQGNARFSCLNLARYAATIASRGTNYKSSLIYKITEYGGDTIRTFTPEVESTFTMDSSYWDAIFKGMRLVSTMYQPLNNLYDAVQIAGKTGTAQDDLTKPSHANYISFAPYTDPEIALAVNIPFGYGSINATAVAADFYRYYYGLNTEEEILTNPLLNDSTAGQQLVSSTTMLSE